jgi:hypothetical protein
VERWRGGEVERWRGEVKCLWWVLRGQTGMRNEKREIRNKKR